MKPLRRVAVLGAGTMGSRIAAHFANAGIPSLLLDVVVPNVLDRNQAARKGLESALKQKPGAFFVESAVGLVETGNFEDHLRKIHDCDWVIEAVAENIEIKRAIWDLVDIHRNPLAILSTNTSGIPLAKLSDGFTPEFRRQFLGTHFFNPPRYLHLLEVIPAPDTDPAILDFVCQFSDLVLGKGVVICKDTPNFIANRLGSFFGGTVAKLMVEGDYTVEEVDELTGPLIGLPRSASFRLLDIVGVDVWAHVGTNLHALVPDDPWRERFLPPPFLDEMLRRGWLGEKSGQGFYRRAGGGKDRTIEVIDWKTLEYHPAAKSPLAAVEFASNIEDLPERLRALASGADRAGAFLWPLFRDTMIYAAERLPEISDRIVEVDRAMRWGYAHPLGPFELWDVFGVREAAARIEKDGLPVPPLIRQVLSSGAGSFYRLSSDARRPVKEYFHIAADCHIPLEERPEVVVLADWKRSRGVVLKNAGASLIDLDGGVLCLEFHTKMNTIGEDIIRMIHAGIEETNRNFQAMIIANEGADFCVGANLMLVLLAAQEGEWDELNEAVHRFQQACMAIKYSPRPIVVAPFGRTLGGGCEIALHGARVQASAELYMGLVETGVGLIPAGGGCKELLLRIADPKVIFETVGFAKVSGSAADARRLQLLDPRDAVSMNRERLIGDAKTLALRLAASYVAPAPQMVPVSGDAGYALLAMGAWLGRQGDYLSDYDLVVARNLAYVLSGGRLTGPQSVPQQYILDLEREAFLSLCGNAQTQARMQHMLKTGKPLRN